MSVLGNTPLLMTPEGYQISRSVRLRSSASAYFNRTLGTPTDGKKYTFSIWTKRGSLGAIRPLIGVYPSSGQSDANTQILEFSAGDVLNFGGFSTLWRTTTQVFRDPSAWYHIVLTYDSTQATAANRELLYVNGVQITSFTTSNDVSLNTVSPLNTSGSVVHIGSEGVAGAGAGRFYDGYMTEVNFIDGQAMTPSSFGETDTLTGVWKPKKYAGTYGTNGFYLPFNNNADTSLLGLNPVVASNYFQYSEQLDNAYWSKLNVTIAANTTDTTDPLGTNTADKLTMSTVGNSYVYRNSAITATTGWVLSGYFKAGTTSSIELYISSSGGADGGLGVFTLTGSGSAGFSPLNGSSGTASIQSVGNGWYRCVLTCRGSSGQNAGSIDAGSTGTVYGWGMQLEIGSTVGTYTQAVASSVINNWTTNNISLTAGATYDSMLDTPTPYADGGNGRGNYAVMNPLAVIPSNTATSFTNGNLTFAPTQAEGTGAASAVTSMPLPTTGKWYWEITPSTVATAAANRTQIGVMAQAQINYSLGAGADCFSYTAYGGIYSKLTAGTYSSYGDAYSANDVIGVAVDLDNGAIYFAKNGTWQNSGVPTSGASKTGAAFTTLTGASNYFPAVGYWGTFNCNFGQRPFAYTPPTGFKALNTQNLPDSTIKAGNKYFDVITYTGDGTSSRTITSSLGFTPDLAWGKSRSGAFSHALVDSVRGNYQTLSSNATAAESAINSYNLSSANSLITWNANETNQNGATYATWLWKKGATQGFDIVTFTGTGAAGFTVNHSLGVAPSMMIVKRRDAVNDWPSYHKALGNTQGIYLNLTNAAGSSSAFWNNTSPTSTQFTLGASSMFTSSCVAYLFAEVAGFSKFGSYTGNGSTDGPFVYCGFRPKFVMFKRTDTANSWITLDSSRSTYNVTDDALVPNLSDAEYSNEATLAVDFTSNGFKIRTTGSAVNASGGTYIYAAFAEVPFRYALGR